MSADCACRCRGDELLEPYRFGAYLLTNGSPASGQLACYPVDATVTHHEPVIDELAAECRDVVVGFAKELVDLRFRISSAGVESFEQAAQDDDALLPRRGNLSQPRPVKERANDGIFLFAGRLRCLFTQHRP